MWAVKVDSWWAGQNSPLPLDLALQQQQEATVYTTSMFTRVRFSYKNVTLSLLSVVRE
jgi:hypothetical protein